VGNSREVGIWYYSTGSAASTDSDLEDVDDIMRSVFGDDESVKLAVVMKATVMMKPTVMMILYIPMCNFLCTSVSHLCVVLPSSNSYKH